MRLTNFAPTASSRRRKLLLSAGGTLAAALVAKAAPDGHTLLYVAASFQIGAATQPSLPYDPVKDFAAIGQTGYGTIVLIAAPELDVKSVKDLIALANSQPGKSSSAQATLGAEPA